METKVDLIVTRCPRVGGGSRNYCLVDIVSVWGDVKDVKIDSGVVCTKVGLCSVPLNCVPRNS